jgi:hypothetical protein
MEQADLREGASAVQPLLLAWNVIPEPQRTPPWQQPPCLQSWKVVVLEAEMFPVLLRPGSVWEAVAGMMLPRRCWEGMVEGMVVAREMGQGEMVLAKGGTQGVRGMLMMGTSCYPSKRYVSHLATVMSHS